MSDQDLFKDDKTSTTQTSDVDKNKGTSTDPTALLSMITNADGKQKYNSLEDAIKGAAHAQVHISNLEKELAQLRSQTENSKKIEDLITTIQAKQNTTQDKPDDKSSIQQPDIHEVVKKVLSDVTVEATRETNIKTVTSKFKELYGDKASETLYSKANDLGMSKTAINSLIAESPQAALKLLGIDSNKGTQDSVKSNLDTSNFQGTPPPKSKSVMGYVSSKDLTNSWLETKKRTNQKLGIEK